AADPLEADLRRWLPDSRHLRHDVPSFVANPTRIRLTGPRPPPTRPVVGRAAVEPRAPPGEPRGTRRGAPHTRLLSRCPPRRRHAGGGREIGARVPRDGPR